MAEIFVVETRGIGKPDYSKAVSSGIERSGLYLGHNQQRRFFYRGFVHADAEYPLIPDTGLAVGASVHLRDSDTLLFMPYNLLAGHALTVLAVGFSMSQDAYIQVFIDDLFCSPMGLGASGASVYVNKLWDVSTLWYDPPAASAHVIDAKIYNEGGGTLYGGVGIWCLIEAVGTPSWPTTKECMCPYCDHVQTVSVEDGRITCEECGGIYLVTTFSSLKRRHRLP